MIQIVAYRPHPVTSSEIRPKKGKLIVFSLKGYVLLSTKTSKNLWYRKKKKPSGRKLISSEITYPFFPCFIFSLVFLSLLFSTKMIIVGLINSSCKYHLDLSSRCFITPVVNCIDADSDVLLGMFPAASQIPRSIRWPITLSRVFYAV